MSNPLLPTFTSIYVSMPFVHQTRSILGSCSQFSRFAGSEEIEYAISLANFANIRMRKNQINTSGLFQSHDADLTAQHSIYSLPAFLFFLYKLFTFSSLDTVKGTWAAFFHFFC